MGTYGEPTGTFLGYKLDFLAVEHNLCQSKHFWGAWDDFRKSRPDYDLDNLVPLIGDSYHKCGYSREYENNVYYIGISIEDHLVIKLQDDNSVTAHLDFTFPPNIREALVDFWLFVEDEDSYSEQDREFMLK